MDCFRSSLLVCLGVLAFSTLGMATAEPLDPITLGEAMDPDSCPMTHNSTAHHQPQEETAPELQSPQDLIMVNMMRDGSGTGWQPSDNPMMMKMGEWGSWQAMFHGSVFADYTDQGGRRGGEKFVSENWLMGSLARPVGRRGVIQLRGMLSAEPLTVGKAGYPLLFQTGEALHGEPLIDRQHPHDLFMELSAQALYQVTPKTWLRLYVAPVGEAALGPTAFPHRYSDFLIPEAPLTHHILDSTHVCFGVATVGLLRPKWQLEGSIFNSREPDENRYDFDYNAWHTGASGRLTYTPTPQWAFQVSSGFLKKPEALENTNVERTTASASYSKTWKTGWWSSTLALGHNFEPGPDDNAVLLESTLNFKDKNYVFGRIENLQRHGLLREDEGRDFNLTAFSLGAARDLAQFKGIPLTLGAMITLYAKPTALSDAYGSFPVSFHVFLHTNAPRMRMHRHSMHHP